MKYAWCLAMALTVLTQVPDQALAGELAVPALPPWSFQDGSGKQVGVFIDLARELVKRSGGDEQVAALPPARIVASVADGSLDGALYPVTPALSARYQLVATVVSVPIFVCPRKGVTLTSRQDLKTLGEIGVPRGLTVPGLTDDASLKISPEVDPPQALRKLAGGRLAAAVGTAPAIMSAARELGLLAELGDCLTVASIDMGFYLSPKLPQALRDKFSAAAKASKEDGTITRIRGAYLTDNWEPR